MMRLRQVYAPGNRPRSTHSRIADAVPVLLDLALIRQTERVTAQRRRRSTLDALPIVVIRDGDRYLILDGNHRYHRKAQAVTRDGRAFTSCVVLMEDDRNRLHGTLTTPLRQFREGRLTYTELLNSAREAADGCINR